MAKANPKATTTPRTLLAALSTVLRQMEAYGLKNSNPLTEDRSAARQAALGEIHAICETMMQNSIMPLSREDANKWIDAALAAGISFERHCNARVTPVAVSFRMRYSTGHAVAQAFQTAASYSAEEMGAALEARWHHASNIRHARACDLTGGNDVAHAQILTETQTELTIARLRGKADRRGVQFGERA